ncbi:MAG: TetR family transcriptional regulator [Actinobacteria bacterium]|nr:TetR family transcriptional regulator [Actinomycetota bacterium]
MKSQMASRRRSRDPLTRERVLDTAVALADQSGIESLSMRKLAMELGFGAMALYKHVANKEDMLDAMVDVIFNEMALPPTEVPWREAMRRRALSAREVLSRHPWAIGLTDSRMKPGPANLHHHDAVLGCLRRAGFSVALAIHAYSTLDSYIYGFALQEQSLPFDNPDEVGDVAETMLEGFPVDTYPYLAETIVAHLNRADWEFGDEFERGLDLILDGLERLLKD